MVSIPPKLSPAGSGWAKSVAESASKVPRLILFTQKQDGAAGGAKSNPKALALPGQRKRSFQMADALALEVGPFGAISDCGCDPGLAVHSRLGGGWGVSYRRKRMDMVGNGEGLFPS
jgi:hypothetical protein